MSTEVGSLLFASGLLVACTAVLVRIVRIIAVRCKILDIPNERSSHQVPVPRLGGAAFVPPLLLTLLVLWPATRLPPVVTMAAVLGALVVYIVSLIDDFLSLSVSVRLCVQLAVTCLVVVICCRHAQVRIPWIIILGGGLALVAVLNIYNFMDGIDGLAALQAVTAGSTWAVIGFTVHAPAVAGLGSCMAAVAMGFLTLNWPPAKMFMGDAGSTVLGFLFGVIPLLALAETRGTAPTLEILVAGMLVIWPFLADGVFTLIRRLWKAENILSAHRSHLYQRLVIAGQSHVKVTVAYGALAAIGGVFAFCLVRGIAYILPSSIVVVAGLFGLLWQWTVACERRLSAP